MQVGKILTSGLYNSSSRYTVLQVQELPSDSETSLITKSRILLVDDNDILRKSLCLVLEHNGFEVVTAANVNDALKLIGAETFDVLLSDLQMPNAGDGLTVVSAMHHSNPDRKSVV